MANAGCQEGLARETRTVFKAACRPAVDAVNILVIPDGEATHEDLTIV